MKKLTCLLIITLTVMLPACSTAELSEEGVLFYQARTEEWEAALGPYHLWNYYQRAMFCSIYHRLPGDYFNPEEPARNAIPTLPPEDVLSYEDALYTAVEFLCSYDVRITEDDLHQLYARCTVYLNAATGAVCSLELGFNMKHSEDWENYHTIRIL